MVSLFPQKAEYSISWSSHCYRPMFFRRFTGEGVKEDTCSSPARARWQRAPHPEIQSCRLKGDSCCLAGARDHFSVRAMRYHFNQCGGPPECVALVHLSRWLRGGREAGCWQGALTEPHCIAPAGSQGTHYACFKETTQGEREREE